MKLPKGFIMPILMAILVIAFVTFMNNQVAKQNTTDELTVVSTGVIYSDGENMVDGIEEPLIENEEVIDNDVQSSPKTLYGFI